MSDAVKAALVAAAIAGIIVAFPGSAAFVSSFSGLFGLGSAAASFVAFSAVMAFATTGLNMMLAPDPPEVATSNFGTKTSTRDANAPRQIVYGRTRIGGTITQMESTGADNNRLSLFIVLAGHEIESLEKVFINDTDVVLGTNTSSATTSGETVFTVTSSNFTNTDNDNSFGSGRLIRFTFHDGSQTARDGLALATLGASAVPTTHKFTDCAYVYMEIIYDPEILGQVPQLSFEVKGKNIFDPRSNALSTTDAQRSNPALIIRDFLTDTTYGLKATSDEINDTTNAGGIASAANTCDQDVTLADGSSTETRYTCNGFTDMGADMNDFFSAALSTMAGTMTYSNGKFNVFAGANQTASLTITDDDCLSDLTITKKNLSGGLFNTVKSIFTDKDNNFIGADAPILQNSTFLSQDTPSGESSANYVKTMEIRLPFTTSQTAAQRLQKIALEHQRQTTTISGLFGLEFMKLQPKDYVNVTNTRLDFSSKLFEVVSIRLDVGESEGNTFLATRLELKEIATSVYDFATNEYTTPITVTTIQNKGTKTLQGVTGANRSQIATKEGVQTKINILVSWTARNDPSIISTEVQFKLSGDSTYKSVTVGPKTAQAIIPNVAVGETYNIRLRNIGKNAEVSAFTVLSDLTIIAVTTAPDAPSNLAVASDNPLLIGLSWTYPNNADLRAVKIYRKTSNNTPTDDTDLVETIYGEPNAKGLFFFGKHDGLSAGTVYYFWMRSINHSGVHSSFTASVNGSFKNIVAGDVDTTFSNTIAFKSNLTDGATVISGSNIQTGTLNADRIGTGTLNGSNVSVTNLSASNITGGTLSADRISGSSLDIASKGIVGSAGNIAAGTGSISQTTNSVGTVNKFFGGGSFSNTFLSSSPFHKNGTDSLGEIASVTFTTTTRTKNYNFLGVHTSNATFTGDEEKLVVISLQNSSGTVLSETFQFTDFGDDIMSIALNASCAANTTFTVRLYAGYTNADTNGGILRLSGNLMVFGLGL